MPELSSVITLLFIMLPVWKIFAKSLTTTSNAAYSTTDAADFFSTQNLTRGMNMSFWQSYSGIFTGLGILSTGHKKSVNVYLPLACDKNLHNKTFDENLDALLSFKKILSENVLFPTDETTADINTLIEEIAPSAEKNISPSCWTIEVVDFVTGLTFEKIICDLYNAIENFSADITPATNDFGADVVVKSLTDNTGLLIQCKHRRNLENSLGSEAVREIFAAVKHYEKKYCGRKFQPVVITNAKKFTSGAIELARDDGVKLIARRELEKMFCDYKILRC